jgi:hypothetical protein
MSDVSEFVTSRLWSRDAMAEEALAKLVKSQVVKINERRFMVIPSGLCKRCNTASMAQIGHDLSDIFTISP